ncbi:MAG TPA: S-layer family protein, partial [Allocoleopsis sp.]
LTLESGGNVKTSTSGSGNAGNINIQVKNYLNLTGNESGLFADTAENSTGNSGNIWIDPEIVNINDQAQISVNSQGTGNGGNIQLFANILNLNNQGAISASTASAEGGNIFLQIGNYLLMGNNSFISATAGLSQGAGNGGSVDISAPFILVFINSNSDITANAFKGKGGNINITSNGLYGIEFREKQSPKSDITASSEFGLNGSVQINTPGIDPSRGLNNLPANIVDGNSLLDRSCQGNYGINAKKAFVIIKREGLPFNPIAFMEENYIKSTWINSDFSSHKTSIKELSSLENNQEKSQLVEAQGWAMNEQKEVVLIAANVEKITPATSWQKAINCPQK